MAGLASRETLDGLFKDIKTGENDEAKQQAALVLRQHVDAAHRDLQSGEFSSYYDDVIKRMSTLVVHGQDNNERIGGIMALSALIDFRGDDAGFKIAKFSGILLGVLGGNDVPAMGYAAEALGRLVAPMGTLSSGLIESEIKTAIENLQSDRKDQENRRLAAVMILREMARHAPTIVHGWVNQIFDVIWLPLRDSKHSIRDAAAEAVGACVDILAARDTITSRNAIGKLFDYVSSTLKPGATIEAVHGALLVVNELLRNGGVLMDSTRYRELAEWVLTYRDHRDSMIKRIVVKMMPQLAAFSPSEFSSRYLSRCMHLLSALLKREKERAGALRAVGGIADAVGSNIAPHLDEIVSALQDGLAGRARQSADPAVFECLGTVSAAVGQALGRYVAPLLDALFQTNLSSSMTDALRAMVQHIPSVKPAIQTRLLDSISEVLCGRPFRAAVGGNGGSGRPGLAGPSFGIGAGAGGTKETVGVGAGEDEMSLALRTLGTFDFGAQPLGEFVRTVVVKFVDNDYPGVRREAALACCRLFGRDPVAQQTGAHAQRLVGDVVGRLVAVGVADSSPVTRLSVLEALPARFDRQLGRPEHVRSLVLAVHDGPLAVREAAVAVLGRIVAVNPATVLPSLRKALVQLLTEVEYASHAVAREEAARLVGKLVDAGPGLVRPYAWAVAEVLLPRADDASAAVAATAMDALGKLTGVGGAAVSDEVVSRLMKSVVSNLKESGSTERRLAALGALRRLAENCSYVIQPFIDQPELAGLLHGIVRSEGPGVVRQETVRVLGVLGAIDPDLLGPNTIEVTTTPAVDGAEAANTTTTGVAAATHTAAGTAADGGMASSTDAPADMALILDGMSPSSDEYYPSVCIRAFTSVLGDPQLAQYHHTVIEGMMNMYNTLGLRCVAFLDKVVPGFIAVIEAAPVGRVEGYFAQLAQLIRIVRNHIRPFLTSVLATTEAHWIKTPSLRATLLGVVDASARAVEGEFGKFLAPMLKLLLAVLEAPDSSSGPGPSLTERIVREFGVIAPGAEQYMPLIIPAVVSAAERTTRPVPVRRAAIETLNRLSRKAGVAEFASRIVHGLCSVIATDHSGNLRPAALDALCALVYRLGPDFLPFAPTVVRVLTTARVTHLTYNLLIQRLSRGQPLPPELSAREDVDSFDDGPSNVATVPGPAPRAHTNQEHLRSAWLCTRGLTAEDWTEWIGKLCLALVRESPQPAMRACAPLVRAYAPLGRRLFNSAFVSCWPELRDHQQELVSHLEVALTSPTLPPDILQLLLNLAEFMEHDDKPLPIDFRLLGLYAHQCHAFAKALHYKELEFNTDQRASAVEALISLNNHLHQSDAAVGILRRAHDYGNLPVQEHWYERLYRWDDALAAYRRREATEGVSSETTLGQMRCLHALGEWDVLSSIAQEKWLQATGFWRRQMAPLAAAAAWGLGRWELMDRYVGAMKAASPDRAFFSAILAIHRHQFAEAGRLVERARSMLETELFALLAESYERAYLQVLRLQMLAELDEIMIYKGVAAGVPNSAVTPLGPDGNPVAPAPAIEPPSARLATMRNTWERRLRGCQPNPEVWQRMMKVRSLVLGPSESMGVWVRYANLCRRSGRMGLAEKALRAMLGACLNPTVAVGSGIVPVASAGTGGPIGDAIAAQLSSLDPSVAYAALKFLWASGERSRALVLLQEFTSKAEPISQSGVERNGGGQMASQETKTSIDSALLARCFLKQGRWLAADPGENMSPFSAATAILDSYTAATRHNGSWHKAWHALALAHFELVSSIVRRQRAEAAKEVAKGNEEKKGKDGNSRTDGGEGESNDPDPDAITLPPGVVRTHVVPAVNGFFRAIALSPAHALQDALRVITLWFAHGRHPDVIAAVMHGLGSVTVDTWLDVIPQILARINQPNRPVRETIHRLLTDLGRAHPHAVVFPFIVALKSDTRRSRAALALMDSMKLHSPTLVEHADLVSRELIRIAVIWHEQWFEGLEDASRLYFGDRDIAGMFATLKPLHDMLDREPETLREISFIHTFGRELHEARRWCVDFHTTRNAASLNQAWDLYYQVFKKLQRHLTTISTLEFQYVSPRLQSARDLVLAVPGTYRTGKPVITIASFNPVAVVFVSKQRPRKFSLVGSDGVTYQYILKGHEDIRQDERVMQLFGLCNTLLAGDGESRKRQLHIQRFAVIPLSTSSGLLGFVPNSDTFHTLIRGYRESRKILINIEQRIMLQMAPDYDSLTLLQKVEVFSYALDNTTGQDLYRVLWLKSRSSEAWLVRRTNYTRSLAVMSIVGYLLGLGDRHPSNLMMDRFTGQVIHIDFGDCFESAMQREKYPEQVPFRLTRMLTYAMEVSNIEGSYRISSEHTMRVLRQNRDSVVAVMEAFVHDPLITWRLKKFESLDPDFATDVTGPTTTTADPAEAVNGAGAGARNDDDVHPGYRTFRRASMRQRALTHTLNVTGNAQRQPGGAGGFDDVTAKLNQDRQYLQQQAELAAKFAAVSGAAAAAVAGAGGDGGVYSGRPNSISQMPGTVGGGGVPVGGGVVDNVRPGAADPEVKEVRNARALQVISRLKEKLNGRDFPPVEGDDSVHQLDGGDSGLTRKNGHGVGAEFTSILGINNGMSSLNLGAAALGGKGVGIGYGGMNGGSGNTGAVGAGTGGGIFGEAASSDGGWELPVDAQVDRLIREATSLENLCQHFIGWCAFW